MITFYYDRTFEGLLTALFDAYDRKQFPDHLVGEDEVEPLFTEETHHVITENRKAGRVWKGLAKKLEKNVCNMLFYVWLSELPEREMLLFRYMRKVFDNPHFAATDFTDDDILQVSKIAHKVSKERLFIIQFVRFQKAADDIFFAPIIPQYNALPLAISHFVNRFADQKWVIYDLKRKYGYYYNLQKVVEITLEDDTHLLGGKLDEAMMSNDEKLFQELWRGYIKSMTIKERINPKLQRQHIPRRFWKYLTEKTEN